MRLPFFEAGLMWRSVRTLGTREGNRRRMDLKEKDVSKVLISLFPNFPPPVVRSSGSFTSCIEPDDDNNQVGYRYSAFTYESRRTPYPRTSRKWVHEIESVFVFAVAGST